MPEHDLTGRAPSKPHLALRVEHGLFTAIPEGAVMAQILDPEDRGKIQMLLLVKVKDGEWTFRCMCNPECHAVVTYRASTVGSHRGKR